MSWKVHSKSMKKLGEDIFFSYDIGEYLIAGVADGHGGVNAANLCKNEIVSILSKYLNTAVEDMLRNTFEELHTLCLQLTCCSGCTLTVVALHKCTGEYTCANVGDCHAIQVKEKSHMWITTSHRLQDNANERQRLKSKISYIRDECGKPCGPPRLYPGGLASSRSIGDADCEYISCNPSLYSDVLCEEDALVMCSDGIWDHGSVKKIVKVTRETFNPEFICNIASHSMDDATAVIITKQKIKTSMHVGLFKLFSRSGSTSSMSSEEGESPTIVKVNL